MLSTSSSFNLVYFLYTYIYIPLFLLHAARASIWMQFGDIEVLDLPVGKLGMLLLLLLFRNPLLYLIGFSRGVLTLTAYLAELNITFDRIH